MPLRHNLRSRSPTTSRAQPEPVGADRFPLDVVIALGLPGTGKSSEMKNLCAHEQRLIVWDPNDEWRTHRCQRVDSLAALTDVLRAAGAGPVRVAFVPTDYKRQFLTFCMLARAAAEPHRRDRAPCCVMVEELGDVVAPGKAPAEWGMLTRGGRHRGLRVRAVGHSPKEIDKTALKFASIWRVHALGSAGDALYMSKEILFVDVAQIQGLAPYDFVEVGSEYPRVPVRKRTSPA